MEFANKSLCISCLSSKSTTSDAKFLRRAASRRNAARWPPRPVLRPAAEFDAGWAARGSRTCKNNCGRSWSGAIVRAQAPATVMTAAAAQAWRALRATLRRRRRKRRIRARPPHDNDRSGDAAEQQQNAQRANKIRGATRNFPATNARLAARKGAVRSSVPEELRERMCAVSRRGMVPQPLGC